MSTIIKAKRSSVQGKVPVTTDLELGEFAINTYDGKLFTKKNVNGTESIVDLSLGTTNLGYSANSTAVTVTSDTGSDINILAANGTIAGVLTAGTQTIAGAKTFTGDIVFDATGGNEGGEIKLAASPIGGTLAGSVSIDIYQNRLRIFENGGSNRGVYMDLTTAASSVGTNLLSGSVTNISTSANGSTVTVVSDTGSDGVILAANSTTAGVITAEAQTIGGAKTFTGNVTADKVIASNNGNGTNFQIGDDVWIGDINTANTLRITGQQDATQGYIVFGNSNTTALGRTGTGSLTYGGSAIILASDTASTATASKVVIRDSSSNFAANTITAALAGNATTATTLQTARTIGGVSFDGSANINLPGVNATGNQNTTGSAATLTTARNINGVSFNGSANITVPSLYDTNYRRITNPGGAEYVTTTATVTGAIEVVLPVGMTNTMMRMTIKIYEYATNESFEVIVGGYNYNVGNTWSNNPFAYIIGNPGIDRRFTVRFGYNAAGRAVVYIGELASTWSYPQVFVTDVQLGFGGQSATWVTGWAVNFQATAFENVTATITNPQIGYAVSTNTANATVLRDGSGNFSAGTITAALSGNATTATTLQTARTIGGVSFNGSANINLPGVNTTGNQNTTGSAATLTTARTIALSGDVAGSATFDGSANVTITATIQANSVALGTDTTGDYVAGLTGGTGVTISGTAGEGWSPTVAIGQAVSTTSDVEFRNLVLSGNLTVNGTSTTVNATELAIEDNLIYLNEGSTITNPDIGIVGNYNDGTYAHTGVFRDATDGRWKFFKGYVPEPGQTIDTANATFQYADVQANTFYGALSGNATTATTLQTARTIGGVSFDGSANINLPGVNTTGNQNTTGSAATLTTARTIAISGDVTGTATSFNGSANITISADITANTIVNADINTAAAIADTKLATISTAGKVLNSATTATNAATASAIVARDASGNFSANTITAALSGNATTATTLQTARNINGTSFNGSADITITSNTTNALTFNNSGSGVASGNTFNGSAAVTVSHNTIGASPLAGSTSLTTTGTVTTGTWSGSFGAVSGANLTNLTAGNLSGTIPSAVLGNSSLFVGTTSVALNRASSNLGLTGITSIAMPGATSGTITITPAATAGTTAITIPATTGTLITSGDTGTVTSTMILDGTIVNADINASAAIADTKLATISTAGKVSNSATTATNLNTASAIVARDASGNFTAGTITAALTGAASSNVLKAGDTMTGKLNLAGNDSFRLIESLNTSASSAAQFYVEHNLGATNVGNARGVLNLVSTGALTIGGSVALTASNFNTYAPTLTGTGASGNWGINITGNAATVTNGALTTGTLAQFAATTSSQLAGVISDETGSGALVFGTSPSFTTGIDAASATMALFDTTATTVNAFGATTTLNLGYDATAASTTNISIGAVAAATTKTVNIGTGGAASSTTNINIGSSNGGTTTISSPTIVGSATTQALLDTVATTVNFAGAATTGNFGYDGTAASTTNLSVGATISGSTKTVNIGTAGASGSITNINIGSATAGAVGNTVINSTSLIVPGNISLGANILATTGPILTLGTLSAGGTGYMNGTHTNQALTGGTGAYMLGTVTVALGVVTGITLTWGGNRYSVGDVLTVPSLTTTIATTATTGDGTTATITFAAQAAAPFEVGSQIIVAGVTPTGYNGTFTVTACTTTSVSFANATTGAQTVAGTVKMGAALTNSTIPVATVQGTDLYISSYTSDSIGARIRLEANDTATVAGQEYGAITFGGRDASTNGSGDLALIRGVGAGTAGGSDLQFWTGANGAAPTISATITSGGNLRLYNSAGTFYSEFSNNPTANRTLTVPDIAGTVSIIQSAATAGYFDTSATTPTGTTRLNYGGYFYPTALNLIGQSDTSTAATHYLVETGSDGFVRPKTLANVQTEIVTSAVLGSGTANSTTYLRGDRTWQTVTSGITITDDTTTNATRYLTFTSATSGSISAENVSSTKLTFNPSTGDFTAGGNVTAYSDIRLKTNIRTIDDALEKVLKLRGVYFDKDGSASLGVIAQEIEEVLPEVVLDGEYKSVAYGNIVGVLIEAIKDQNETINTMQSDIDELKALVKKLMEK